MKLAVISVMRPSADIMYKNVSSGVKISRFGQICRILLNTILRFTLYLVQFIKKWSSPSYVMTTACWRPGPEEPALAVIADPQSPDGVRQVKPPHGNCKIGWMCYTGVLQSFLFLQFHPGSSANSTKQKRKCPANTIFYGLPVACVNDFFCMLLDSQVSRNDCSCWLTEK